MIVIVDYGMGNLRSVSKAFQSQGFNVEVTNDSSRILGASGLVLPGVGAFGDCVKHLDELNLTRPIKEYIASERPFLGICLGLQVLFEGSDESPDTRGLGIFKGHVKRFPDFKAQGLKVPHMGWNTVTMKRDVPILDGIPEDSWFYFVHSFYIEPADQKLGVVSCTYGIEFTAAIQKDNLFACQFHPEKSSELGLRILRNFASLCGEKITATA